MADNEVFSFEAPVVVEVEGYEGTQNPYAASRVPGTRTKELSKKRRERRARAEMRT